jgi:predicted ester cyclase
MIVISGGIIADTRKSDVIQVYDYENSCLIRETKLFRGRSSHKTIVHNGKIIIIGGFYSDN